MQEVRDAGAAGPGGRADPLAGGQDEGDGDRDADRDDDDDRDEDDEGEELAGQELAATRLADEQVAQRALAVLDRKRGGKEAERDDADQAADVDDAVNEAGWLLECRDRHAHAAVRVEFERLGGALDREDRREQGEEEAAAEAPEQHAPPAQLDRLAEERAPHQC